MVAGIELVIGRFRAGGTGSNGACRSLLRWDDAVKIGSRAFLVGIEALRGAGVGSSGSRLRAAAGVLCFFERT